MRVRRATEGDRASWRELRGALEPGRPPAWHDEEITAILGQRFHRAAFVCVEEGGSVLGFAEVSRGLMPIPGAQPGTAGCMDRIGLRPGAPQDPVTHALFAAVEAWTRDHRCAFLTSPVAEGDTGGQVLRARLGFAESRRLVLYSKPVEAPAAAIPQERPGAPSADATEEDAPQPPTAARRWHPDARECRIAGHGLLFALGCCAFAFTDIWSPHPLYGGVLPIVDALFAIYVLGLVTAALYRRRTAARDPGPLLDAGDIIGVTPPEPQPSAAVASAGLAGPGEPRGPAARRGDSVVELHPCGNAATPTAPDLEAVEFAGSPPRSRFTDDER